MQNKRYIKNFILRPVTQFRYVFLIFSILLLGLGFFQSFVMFNFGQTVVHAAEEYNLQGEVVQDIRESLALARNVLIMSFVFVWAASIILGLYITHRFLGPAVQIRRLIEDLKEGRYSSRVSLRKGDEFQDLMADMNGLAAALEKKHGS